MEVRNRIRLLLKDYSLEEILERGELEPIDALEYLHIYGALDLREIIEAVDKAPEDYGTKDDLV